MSPSADNQPYRAALHWRKVAVLTLAIFVARWISGPSSTSTTASTLSGWMIGSAASDTAAERPADQRVIDTTSDAKSFGELETAEFLEGEQPRFEQLLDSAYGAPIAPPKNAAISTELSLREFSTLRAGHSLAPAGLTHNVDLPVMKLIGRVPIHLRLATFDRFDGTLWSERTDAEVRELMQRLDRQVVPLARPTLTMNLEAGQPWIEVNRSLQSPALAPVERHIVQVLHWSTSRIPTPLHPAGVHIDQVDDREAFSWTSDDCLQFDAVAPIPPLLVLHLRSHAVAPLQADEQFLTSPPQSAARYLTLPATADRAAVQKLVDQWCTGQQRGYREVDHIVEKLRENCILDPTAAVRPEATDVVGELLLRSHCGPQYQVATAAAMLLRMRGYPARLATGFYVPADRYDASRALSSVLPTDVHVWVEVCLDGWTWTTVDPSPEHPPLAPPRTLVIARGKSARR